MRFDSSGQWRPKSGKHVMWKDVAPRQPRDNPEYAMYQAVLDAIARLIREDPR